jgi:hypothetical protein
MKIEVYVLMNKDNKFFLDCICTTKNFCDARIFCSKDSAKHQIQTLSKIQLPKGYYHTTYKPVKVECEVML